MSPPAAPPLFEIVKTTLGATSIRNNVVNEIMHNPVGPWKEANILYVDQTQFRRRLWEPFSSQQRFFTVFDVGLGAGANAAAILTAFQEEKAKGCKASLCLVSFEIDLRLMKFTLKHLDHFPELIPFGEAFSTLLEKHHWQGPDIEWYLRKGSFTDKIALESHLANLVLYDAYSPKKNPEMWSYKTFRDLYQKCRKENEGACSLYTYSRSTSIRSALLAAGFFVGQGIATGQKDETTEAATSLATLSHPLSTPWLGRWQRSSNALPIDYEEFPDVDFSRLVTEHPQFS